MSPSSPSSVPELLVAHPAWAVPGGFHTPALGLPSTISPIKLLPPACGTQTGSCVHNRACGTLCPVGMEAMATFPQTLY